MKERANHQRFANHHGQREPGPRLAASLSRARGAPVAPRAYRSARQFRLHHQALNPEALSKNEKRASLYAWTSDAKDRQGWVDKITVEDLDQNRTGVIASSSTDAMNLGHITQSWPSNMARPQF
ncbi:hypothetical protein [Bradyrhizobium sp.]|uniref:hypothetical protein n=1 Tax=Bradyrhizobium sp. TaxID=376 RepID=UPI0025C45371|nr:hypothetical protein [Bradyrhizobium sp.]